MARDAGLEELLWDDLSDRSGLTTKAMFGGLAFMLDGHLLCGARTNGLLLRLGKGNDGWALELDGIEPMMMTGKHMSGWVEVDPDACGDDGLRRRLLDAAIAFVTTLPPKD